MLKTERIALLSEELKSCYEKAGAVEVDFSKETEEWSPAWQKRCVLLSYAEDIDTELRILYDEWKINKSVATPDLQQKIEASMKALVSTLKAFQRQTQKLFSRLSAEKEKTGNELAGLQKNTYAIASYCSHR